MLATAVARTSEAGCFRLRSVSSWEMGFAYEGEAHPLAGREALTAYSGGREQLERWLRNQEARGDRAIAWLAAHARTRLEASPVDAELPGRELAQFSVRWLDHREYVQHRGVWKARRPSLIARSLPDDPLLLFWALTRDEHVMLDRDPPDHTDPDGIVRLSGIIDLPSAASDTGVKLRLWRNQRTGLRETPFDITIDGRGRLRSWSFMPTNGLPGRSTWIVDEPCRTS